MIPAVTHTYLTKTCTPSEQGYSCKTSSSPVTSNNGAHYSTVARYQEASASFGIDGHGDGAWSFQMNWKMIDYSTKTSWDSMITSSISMNSVGVPSVLASQMQIQSQTPDWVESMPSDQLSYFISAYLLSYTTKVTYYELAVQAGDHEVSPAAQTSATTTGNPSITTANVLVPSMPAAAPAMATAPTPTRSTTASTGKWPSKAVTIAVPLCLVLTCLVCGFAILLMRRCANQRNRNSERRTGMSSFRHDYNAPPLFPHRPLGRMSDTSFNSTTTASSTFSMKKHKACAPQATSAQKLHSSPPITLEEQPIQPDGENVSESLQNMVDTYFAAATDDEERPGAS